MVPLTDLFFIYLLKVVLVFIHLKTEMSRIKLQKAPQNDEAVFEVDRKITEKNGKCIICIIHVFLAGYNDVDDNSLLSL